MANAWKGTVFYIDSNGSIDPVKEIVGVKIVGGSATATLTLKDSSSSGTVIYTTSVASGAEKYEQVNMACRDGFYATITGTGATAYVYAEVE